MELQGVLIVGAEYNLLRIAKLLTPEPITP
jgi:hypothetical protein